MEPLKMMDGTLNGGDYVCNVSIWAHSGDALDCFQPTIDKNRVSLNPSTAFKVDDLM